jgi:hypothetical protein
MSAFARNWTPEVAVDRRASDISKGYRWGYQGTELAGLARFSTLR